jgi:hypothetical protein
MVVLALASAGVLAVSALDPAAQPAPQAAQQTAPSAPVVCHIETIPGSRIGAFHVCMTQREWDARSGEAREYLTAMQNRSETFRP